MSWYSTGHEEATKLLASSGGNKRRRNFFVQPGDRATIRFLTPARASFNYKRGFAKWVKGEKMLTSPGISPDPLLEAGLSLQATFGWWVINKTSVKFKDRDTGEEKETGVRVQYFADGGRTQKQLKAFEKEMLDAVNEEREEDGKEPLTLDEFNLTSYDLNVSKDKKAPWNFVAKRPKNLSKDEAELVEKNLGFAPSDLYSATTDKEGNTTYEGPYIELLAEELKPLPLDELRGLLGQGNASAQDEDGNGDGVTYSYEDEEEDEPIKLS